ncbi:MAG: MlaC/ttg2D family ABC transporter substrate-binding protein [Geminicoccaceae bacterium]
MSGRGGFSALRAGMVFAALLTMMVGSHGQTRASEVADQAITVVRDLAADIWSTREGPGDNGTRKQLVAGMLEGKTNVDLLSRLALGKHWRSLEPSDRAEYTALFSNVVIGGLAGRLDSILGELDGSLDQYFTITDSAKAGKKDVLVRSRVSVDANQPLSVDWRLRDLENGPVIIDVVVEGISLLVSQRAEFAAVIERSRMEGLIEALRVRAGES